MNNQNSRYTIFTLIVFSILGLLGGCAQPAAVAPSFALREQLQEIKQQQAAQQQQLENLQQIITRLQQQLTNNQMPASSGREADTHTAQTHQQPEQAGEVNATVTPPPLPLPQAGTAEMVRVADSATSYLTAFSNLASGQYFAAETGFDQFLNTYPDHQYAPNARFWLANAQAAQNKTSQAVSNLRQIIADPAGQEKAPAALVQLIQLYRQAGLNNQADDAMNLLRDNYGNTPEARFFLQKSSGLN